MKGSLCCRVGCYCVILGLVVWLLIVFVSLSEYLWNTGWFVQTLYAVDWCWCKASVLWNGVSLSCCASPEF